jgi:predicted dehydrogenase
MSIIKYGILLVTGGQTHQEEYAAAFAEDDRCKLVGVTDEKDVDRRRRDLNQQLARHHGIPYFSEIDEALANPDVDVSSICTPPERRARVIIRCAEAGKHLYLDKPLAPKLQEADAIVAAVRQAGVHSQMFSFITQPWARQAKAALAQGKIGQFLAIHADLFFAKGKPGSAQLSVPRMEQYPPERHQLLEAKRELDNIGVYPITMIRWLTGKKFRTVFGITANYFFEEHQKQNVEDFGLLSCTLEDGLPVTIAVGRYGWTSHPAGGVNRMILVGSERSLVVDVNRPRLEVFSDETPWTMPAVHPDDPMAFWRSTQQEVKVQPKGSWIPLGPPAASDASCFLDCLDVGRDSDLPAGEAALATEVLLAGYQSAATGEVVTLPLPR